jgi:hypothetical protein
MVSCVYYCCQILQSDQKYILVITALVEYIQHHKHCLCYKQQTNVTLISIPFNTSVALTLLFFSSMYHHEVLQQIQQNSDICLILRPEHFMPKLYASSVNWRSCLYVPTIALFLQSSDQFTLICRFLHVVIWPVHFYVPKIASMCRDCNWSSDHITQSQNYHVYVHREDCDFFCQYSWIKVFWPIPVSQHVHSYVPNRPWLLLSLLG